MKRSQTHAPPQNPCTNKTGRGRVDEPTVSNPVNAPNRDVAFSMGQTVCVPLAARSPA
jgi:hypothetical protein